MSKAIQTRDGLEIRLKIENWGKHRLVPRLRDVILYGNATRGAV